MKEQNNDEDEDQEPKAANQQVFKEAIRKFSFHEQPSKVEVGRKYKRGEIATNGSASEPTQEPLEKIPLNENGKEEFCITFDKESEKIAAVMIKSQSGNFPKRSQSMLEKKTSMLESKSDQGDSTKFSSLQKVTEDEIALRIKSKIQLLKNGETGNARSEVFSSIKSSSSSNNNRNNTKTPQSSRNSLNSNEDVLVQIETYGQNKERPVRRLNSDAAEFSPVKEKLEHMLANHAANNFSNQNGAGSVARFSRQKHVEESNDVITTIDTSTGSIMVDKTTKNQDSVDSATPTTSGTKAFPVPAQRRSLSKRESEEGFVAVERKDEPTPLFSISTFENSHTDYKRIAKAKLQ